MTRRAKELRCGPVVLRLAVSAGLALVSSVGIQPAQAQPCLAQVSTLARGPFTDDIDVRVKARVGGEVGSVQVHDAAEMVVQKITIQPGGFTDWHTHWGPAIVVVVQGVLTLYDGDDPSCTGRPYGPGPAVPGVSPPHGESFVDLGQGHVHNARNEGDVPVLLYVTYFDVPPGGAPLRLADDPEPDVCGFGPRPDACAPPP